MRTQNTLQLLEYLRASVGISAAEDLLYMWIEEAVGVIREQPWPWNWNEYKGLTKSPVVLQNALGVDLTFTHSIGDTYATASAAIPSSYHRYTGRRVYLGDEWYIVTDVGHSASLRLYVDRPIVSEETTGVVLTLYRTNVSLNTSMIANVTCGLRAKLMRYDSSYFHRKFLTTRQDQLDPATPVGYIDHQDKRIVSPLYAPSCVTSGAGTVAVGTYYYFYTRYDVESGLESPPGPVTEFVNTTGKTIKVSYGNPAGDKSESTSYWMRLYRSEANPNRRRTPMFLIQERLPGVPSVTFDDTNTGTMRVLPRLYEGQQTLIEFVPPPDDERLAVVVTYLNNWAYRTYDEENIEMGLDNQVIELLRIFLLGVVKLAGKNPGEYRASVAQFRQQMAYLANKARKSADGDASPENYFDDRPSGSSNTGSWVDVLPWAGD